MDEFTSWMSCTLTLDNDENGDVLLFRRQYGHLYPTIAAIPRDVLAIPTSNTCVKRLFSKSKAIVIDKRTSMDVAKIDRLLFLRKNLNIFKNTFDQDPHEGEQKQVKRKDNQQKNESLDTSSKKSKTKENDETTNQEQENYVLN
jgi:hAT family C-terminal dimerisation region